MMEDEKRGVKRKSGKRRKRLPAEISAKAKSNHVSGNKHGKQVFVAA